MNIHKYISENNNYYLIDGFSNEIYQLDSKNDLNSITFDDLEEFREYQNLIPQNYETNIINNAKTLVLEVTEKCNLRCSYCVFDENFKNERSHSTIEMSTKTAYEAIDNFKNRVNGNEAYIVFYGGEPLTKFNFIKQVVDYAIINIGNYVKFSLTTNGVLFTEDKFDFFCKHNFLITISLDGPKEIHDKYRIALNRESTFDKIIKNLNLLYKYNQTYYDEHIQFNCVINNINDFTKINNFFSSHILLNKSKIQFSNQIQKSQSLTEDINNKFNKEYIINLIKEKNLKNYPIEYEYYGSLLKKIKYRLLGPEAKNRKVKCIPFSNRTYVRTNGKVQFCERIETMGLSNLNTNNMLTNAEKYLKEYKLFKETKCNNCFAYNFCEMCFASFISNGELDEEKANRVCNNYRNEVKLAFEIYIELNEYNEKLLEIF